MKTFVDYAVVCIATGRWVGILRRHRKDCSDLKFNKANMAVISDDGKVIEKVHVRLSTTKAYMDLYRGFTGSSVNYLDVKVDVNTSKEIDADYLTTEYNQSFVNSLVIEKV